MSSNMDRKQLLLKLNQAMKASSTEAILLHQAVADTLGLNITDHKCMDILVRFGPMTAGKLAEITGLTTGAITGVIDRLEKAGYAKRKPDPQDRRAIIIELVHNKELEEKFETIFRPLTKKMEKLVTQYTDEQLIFITEFITQAVQASHEETLRLSKLNKR